MYLENRSASFKKLHTIFCQEIPDFIKEFLEVKEVLRLNKICQHGGTTYTKAGIHSQYNSRLDHSLGVALIVWNFTKDVTQTITALLHDISHTAFSHTGEFIKGDFLILESNEKEMGNVIKNSKGIMKLLDKYNVSLTDITEITKYPLVDNDTPKICADRLEYTLHDGFLFGNITLDEAEKVYNDIYIGYNEEGQQEYVFNNVEHAKKLSELAINNSYKRYTCFCIERYLAEILKNMIKENLIQYNDLFYNNDEQIFDIARNSKNTKINTMLDAYFNIDYASKYSDVYVENKFCVPTTVKKRFIKPLINIDNKVQRLESNQIEEYLNMQIPFYQYLELPNID